MHIWKRELVHKESWVLKTWCFWTVVLEKTPVSPLDCKDFLPVNPKGIQSWKFIGRTDAEAEAPILWPPDTHWKRPWSWERLKVGGEGDNRGCDGWMASPTRWTWVWASFGSWWTGKPGVTVVHGITKSRTQLSDWTELNWKQWACEYGARVTPHNGAHSPNVPASCI